MPSNPPGIDELLITSHTTHLAYGLDSDDTHHFILWFHGAQDDLLEKRTLTGSYVDSFTLGAGYDAAQAVAVDSAGDVYVANISGDKVQKFDGATLDFLFEFGSTEFSSPWDLTVTSHNEVLVINDVTSIAVYDTSGSYQGSFGSFAFAQGIASYGEYVFVVDYNWGTETIYRYKRN